MDESRLTSLRAWAEKYSNPWSGNDQAADAVLELLEEYEIASAKAKALDDIIDACVSDHEGNCLWCGGILFMDKYETGYINQGNHEEDCIFLPFIV